MGAQVTLERIGVPWFPRVGFDELRSIMSDPHAIPDTFAEWERMAQARFKELRQAHAPIRVEKIILEQEPFLAFCRERGLQPDSRGRAQYAAIVAAWRLGN
jgi:hypothetical protein